MMWVHLPYLEALDVIERVRCLYGVAYTINHSGGLLVGMPCPYFMLGQITEMDQVVYEVTNGQFLYSRIFPIAINEMLYPKID